MKLYLASQSPRRMQLLRQIGYAPEIVSADVPEIRAPDESPMAYGLRVAQQKAEAGFAALNRLNDALVLGADTEVILGNRVFGKPTDAADAFAMLTRLSGQVHEVLTAVACVSAHHAESFVQRSFVRFQTLEPAKIEQYLATGEAFGKAGGYAIQGIASCFVAHLEGSYSGVMGLPVHETHQLLQRLGVLPHWQLQP